jgi:lipopolysaccharide transport system permease protein
MRPGMREVVFEPRRGVRDLLDLRDLWHGRELVAILAWRDVRARYSQTILGLTWALVQPLALMLVFTLSFAGAGAGDAVGGPPRSLAVYAGLLPWLLFANGVNAAAASVVGQENLITKARFPRLALPFAALGVALLDFAVGFVVLVGLLVFHGVTPSWSLAVAPVLIAIGVAAALGVGSALAALNVSYRDFRLVAPFLILLWMFATPTLYVTGARPGGIIGDVLAFNPMVQVVDGFRAAVLGEPLDAGAIARAGLIATLALAAGCLYFRRVEDRFADVV